MLVRRQKLIQTFPCPVRLQLLVVTPQLARLCEPEGPGGL